MTHASLFSGIGGFDLAAEWIGWDNIFQVEIDPFCQKVLDKNFPNTKRYADIKKFNGTAYACTIDVISGGFPCQPYSVAGQRKGSDDDRALWPEMFRVICEIHPTWVVCENVTGIISMELHNVLNDLESAGYAVQPFVIPACAVNALHRRDRVWIVANASGIKRDKQQSCPVSLSEPISSDSRRIRWQDRRHGKESEQETPIWREENNKSGDSNGRFKPQTLWHPNDHSHLLRTAYGLPGRVDRNKRIKALGNAIVPQVAYEIFKSIHYAHHHPT